jgi:heterotetrameric sarcosine oxidase gamma subunit
MILCARAIALPRFLRLFITILMGYAFMLDASFPVLAATAAITPLGPRRICSLAAPKVEGLDLPKAGLRAGGVIWNGPGSWLVLEEEAADLAARTGGRVTDQSDGLFLFSISGPLAREILKRLVPVDVREGQFGADAAAITHAAHIGVRIWREGEAFILACFRSFAPSLHHALVEAEESAAVQAPGA